MINMIQDATVIVSREWMYPKVKSRVDMMVALKMHTVQQYKSSTLLFTNLEDSNVETTNLRDIRNHVAKPSGWGRESWSCTSSKYRTELSSDKSETQ